MDERQQPTPAGVYKALAGGIDAWPADRRIASQLASDHPVLPVLVRQNRRFLERAVRRVALLEGVSRFLDLGAGPPVIQPDGTHMPMIHEVARDAGVRPKAVYADSDPLTVVHVEAATAGQAGISAITADLADVAAVLADVRVQDLTKAGRPVAAVLGLVLHNWDADAAQSIVASYANRLPSGSAVILSVSHLSDAAVAAKRALLPGCPHHNHDAADVREFFAGMEYWPALASEDDRTAKIIGGVGITP